ncbi:MAG: hypothetical protein ACREMY_00100 [bacterium]
MNPFTTDELKDMVWLKLGRTPDRIYVRAHFVIAEFDDGSRAVHRIETLLPTPAAWQRWSPSRFRGEEL